MKLAVLSDIHSNLTALDACLAFAKHLGAEGYVFLGDLITDCPDPHGALARLRACEEAGPCWFVRGNREDYLLEHDKNPEDGWRPSSQTGSLLYTYERLTREDLDFLGAMPRTERVELAGCPPVRICHGSPHNTSDLIYPGAEHADSVLRQVAEGTLLAGHCHLQFRYDSGGKQLINPGVVGMPCNGNTKAQFALLGCEDGRWQARMLNIDYDRAAELKRFDGSGLDEEAGVWAKLTRHNIATGKDLHEECLTLARRLAQADENAVVGDVYWEAAAKQMGVI